jgi:RNase P subunit RPR2
MLSTVRKFLFKCSTCKTILIVDLEEKEDIKKAQNDEVVLECSCGGECLVLLD